MTQTEEPDRQQQPRPGRKPEPALSVEMVKDLDVAEEQSDALRGGNSGGGTRGPGIASR